MIPTTQRDRDGTSRSFMAIRSHRLCWRYAPQSYRSLGTLNQPKARKVGRPKMAKGHAKPRLAPARFNPDLLKRVTTAAKANRTTVSEWIRSTLDAATAG